VPWRQSSATVRRLAAYDQYLDHHSIIRGEDVMPRDCDGWVWTLRDQLVYFTGTMTIGGQRYLRDDCQTMVVTRGGDWQTDYSRKVTLLVHGDLDPRRVHDPIQMRSKKLRDAAEAELKGYHTCIVDQDGFAALLDRFPAPCRRIERTPAEQDEVIVHPGIVVEPFGAPLQRRNGSVHLPGSGLTLDLNQLGAGTEAHEQTVEALVRRLGLDGIIAYGPDHRGPQFDAGWRQGDAIWLAEVKSLRNTDQSQIRLGVGQILDYVSQVRAVDPSRHVQAALVLEQEPSDLQRWKTLATDSNLVLSWAPNFRGLGVSAT
jgi:hypothetical protein